MFQRYCSKSALLALGAALVLATSAHAEVDTAISGMVTDQTTLFGLIKTYKISIMGFMIALALIGWLRRK